jgi:CRISPR-associated protein Cmr5
MVRMAGLAATVAFLVAKSGRNTPLERAYDRVATGIRERLVQAHAQDLGGPVPSNEALVARLARMSPNGYARASVEVEALAGWLSRLADARFKATAT